MRRYAASRPSARGGGGEAESERRARGAVRAGGRARRDSGVHRVRQPSSPPLPRPAIRSFRQVTTSHRPPSLPRCRTHRSVDLAQFPRRGASRRAPPRVETLRARHGRASRTRASCSAAAIPGRRADRKRAAPLSRARCARDAVRPPLPRSLRSRARARAPRGALARRRQAARARGERRDAALELRELRATPPSRQSVRARDPATEENKERGSIGRPR